MLLPALRRVFLWAMLFAVGVVSPLTFAYDGHRQATVAYDAPSLAAFDYDVAFVFPANESENRTGETGGIFAQLAEFLAAEEAQMLFRGVPGNGTQKAILGEQGIAIPRGAALDEGSLVKHVLGRCPWFR